MLFKRPRQDNRSRTISREECPGWLRGSNPSVSCSQTDQKMQSPGVKTRATNAEIADGRGLPDIALIFAGIPQLMHSKNRPSSSGQRCSCDCL
jgi:hypothetical protein